MLSLASPPDTQSDWARTVRPLARRRGSSEPKINALPGRPMRATPHASGQKQGLGQGYQPKGMAPPQLPRSEPHAQGVSQRAHCPKGIKTHVRDFGVTVTVILSPIHSLSPGNLEPILGPNGNFLRMFSQEPFWPRFRKPNPTSVGTPVKKGPISLGPWI